jgi:hypothetical protein
VGSVALTLSDEPTDAEFAAATVEELEAWADANAIGPWEPNDVVPPPPPEMTSITIRMPRDLLAELKAEASLHHQPYQRYMKDLLLLALRQVQGHRTKTARPAQVRLTAEQTRDFTQNGELILRLSGSGR